MRIFIFFLLLIIISGCESLTFHADESLKNVTEIPIVKNNNIGLNFDGLKDSVVVWGNQTITIRFGKLPSNDIHLILVFIDSTSIRAIGGDFDYYMTNGITASFNSTLFQNGLHELKVKLFYKMNNESIGSKNNTVFFDSTLTQKIIIDNSKPSFTFPTVTNFQNKNGYLTFTISKYENLNFQKYEVYKNGNLLKTILNNAISEIIDSSFIGIQSNYSVKLFYADKTLNGNVFTTPSYWQPNLKSTSNTDFSIKLNWSKNPFWGAVKKIELIRETYGDQSIVESFNANSNQDSTLTDSSTAYGGIYRYKLQYYIEAKNGQIINSEFQTDEIKYGTINPTNLTEFYWSKYRNKMYYNKKRTSYDSRYIVSFYNYDLTEDVSINDGMITQYGDFIIQTFDSSIKILDPSTLQPKNIINAGKYYDYKYWVDFYFKPWYYNYQSYLPINLSASEKDLSESKIFAFKPILGLESSLYGTSDVLFFDLNQNKFLFTYRFNSPAYSVSFGFLSNDGVYYSSNLGNFKLNDSTLVPSNTNTGNFLKARLNINEEYYKVAGNILKVFSSSDNQIKKAFLLGIPSNQSSLNKEIFLDEANTNVGIYIPSNKQFYYVNSTDGSILKTIKTEQPSKVINNILFVSNFYLRLDQ